MSKLLLFIATISCLLAQSTVSLSVPNNAKAGSNVVLTTSQVKGNSTGIEYVLSVTPATSVTNIIATLSGVAAGSTISKQLNCGAYSGGFFTCIIYGINSFTIPDGQDLTYTVTLAKNISGSIQFAFGNIWETDTVGGPISVTTPFPSGSLSITNGCDLNGDGVVDVNDFGVILGWVLKTGSIPNGQTCDLNGDNICNIFDVAVIEQAIQTGTCTLGTPLVGRKKVVKK